MSSGVLLSCFREDKGLEEDRWRFCEDTARPSPGETKDSQMSVRITSNKLRFEWLDPKSCIA
jgi:hypothetical protein